MTHDRTAAFYTENAEVYAKRERRLPQARLDLFLSLLPAGASILELGCGGGQDSAYMLSKGYDVTPTDGSPELAAEAEQRIGRPVRVMRFDELNADAAYDGVWAQASLLHVPRSDLSGVLARILRALRPNGAFHASFKAGDAEGHDSLGRYYNYPSADWLDMRLREGGWREVSITEEDGGGYDGTPTRWLYASAMK